MIQEMTSQNKVVGVKQSRKAITEGRAAKVFFGTDADPLLINGLRMACQAANIPTDCTHSCEALGKSCRISVSAAVVALLNP